MGFDAVLGNLKVASDYWLIAEEFAFIEGFLDPIEGYALLLLAEHGPGTGSIVEIGSYAGRSTAYLARGSKRARREKVVAIDHFEGSKEHQRGDRNESAHVLAGNLFEVFSRNLKQAGVKDWVHVVRAGSSEAHAGWSHPIRLLFIDGDHSYESSRQDYESWSRWLVPDGLAVFHDIGVFEGVTRYYEELLGSGAVSEILHLGTLRTVAAAKRRNEATA